MSKRLKSQSHPSWVRGLKFGPRNERKRGRMSHPSWVRGLKSSMTVDSIMFFMVASFMGAWIEMENKKPSLEAKKGRILHGCVD